MNINTNTLIRLIQGYFGSQHRKKATVDNARIPEGPHEFDQLVTVRVKGTIMQKKDSLVPATCSLPLLEICCAAAHQCGATRESFFKNVLAIAEQHMSGNDQVEKSEEYEVQLDNLQKKVIKKLPKIYRRGQLTYENFEVEIVE